MNWRTFVTGLGAALAAAPVAVAQQTGKVYRVGVLSLGPPSTFPQLMEAFREGMREVGYVEGGHYVLEIRHAADKPDDLPDVARTLVARGVDVILVGAGRTLSAAAATQTIPIVVAGVTPDPVRHGVATSLARLPVRHGDGLIVFSESPLWARRARIAELVARKKLPAIYTLKAYVEAGGLMSYAANYEDLFRRSAIYVDKILRAPSRATSQSNGPAS
jgi:putative ABC transport system substrate-binding protein